MGGGQGRTGKGHPVATAPKMIQERRNHPLYQVLRQNHPTLYISRLKVLVSLGNPERGARGAKTVSGLMDLSVFDAF